MENNQPQLNEHNKTEYPPMHTCEHVVNRTMVNLFGCGRAVSAHIERKKSKLDFALTECPTDAQIEEIERVVNETLRKNLPVTMEFISQNCVLCNLLKASLGITHRCGSIALDVTKVTVSIN